MKTKIMEITITSEMVSQNTFAERWKDLENIGNSQKWLKKVSQAFSKDKEDDKAQSSEGITEIEQTGKNLIKAYFNFLQMQKRQIAHKKAQ